MRRLDLRRVAALPRQAAVLLRDFGGLRRLWPHLRAEKRPIALAVALIPVVSAFQMALPLILKHSIDEGVAKGDLALVRWSALIYGAAVLGEFASRAGQRWTAAVIVQRMIRELRMKLIAKVLSLSARFHDRSLSGALVTRATGDFDGLNESLNQGVLSAVVDLAVLGGVLVGLFVLDWKLALAVIGLLPFVGAIVTAFSAALKRAMHRARAKIAALNAFAQECLYGNQTIKLLSGQRAATARYETLNEEFRKAQMDSVVLDSLMFSVIEGLASIAVGVVLWVAVSGVLGERAGSGALTAGLLVALVQYIQQLFEPLKQLGARMALMQGAFTSMDRIFGVLEETDHVEGAEPPPARLEGRVEFESVGFAYRRTRDDTRARPVLHDVSFSLQPGQSLALVGATGSGKSTIAKLLSKQYDGYTGSIRVDGRELRAIDGGLLRRRMGIVPQDIVLFEGSVEFNISLGAPGVTREAVEAAARAVGADAFIRRLPGGYEHPVRERGANLSHGQRQLIAFARALARDPSLVILDEATSSVDPESEALIQSAIGRILRGRTVVVIAHRLSTIERCDQILVLDRGRVVERGTHAELAARGGAYADLRKGATHLFDTQSTIISPADEVSDSRT